MFRGVELTIIGIKLIAGAGMVNSMDQLALGKILMKVGDLPSLPGVANRVIELTDNPNSNPQQICDEICRDHVLASKVLKMVNSAYYGLPRKIATIPEATTILGMQMLRTLVIGTSVFKVLSGIKGENAINPEKIRQHALACAVSSRMIAIELGVPHKNHAFMAGLLHDIGKIILNSFFSREYSEVLELSETRGCPFIEAEQELLGTTHAEIGMMVATKWNLPTILVEPIGYHHVPLTACENTDLVLVVYLADITSRLAGYNASGNTELTIDNAVINKTGLNYEKLHRLANEIKGTISLEFI